MTIDTAKKVCISFIVNSNYYIKEISNGMEFFMNIYQKR